MASSSAATAALHQIACQSRAPRQLLFHPLKPATVKLSLLLKPKLHKLSLRRRRGGARMADTAAGSYATALADVASSNDTLEKTYSDLEKVTDLFSEDSVQKFFSDPTVLEEEKHNLIDEISKSSELQPHVVNFLSILVDMKRIDILKDIVKEFEVVYNKLTETELAVVSSVVPLESDHLAQIAKGVQGLTGSKNVRIKTVIEPSLVAGFTVRYGNSGSKMIDLSVKKQLEEIAEQLDLGDIQLVA